MKRGEIWLCSLDTTLGSEIRKTRPCLIVSPDELNGRLSTAIVAPLTSGSHSTRFRVPANFQGKDRLVLPDQARTLDRRRFVKLMGNLDEPTLSAVLHVLRELFT